MKRSEINSIIRSADQFIKEHCFFLPPFAYWTPEEWKSKGSEFKEIVERGLGWDITDFGSGQFNKNGLLLFTIRNGDPANLIRLSGKLYAEKLLISNPDQLTPMHFHWRKTEDIINRGGGDLLIKVYNSTPDERLDYKSDVIVSLDGWRQVVKAGTTLTLTSGMSITLPSKLYHQFWGKNDRVMIIEVSLINDDKTDNKFLEPISRFPEIEEDEPPLYLLCNDYLKYFKPGK